MRIAFYYHNIETVVGAIGTADTYRDLLACVAQQFNHYFRVPTGA